MSYLKRFHPFFQTYIKADGLDFALAMASIAASKKEGALSRLFREVVEGKRGEALTILLHSVRDWSHSRWTLEWKGPLVPSEVVCETLTNSLRDAAKIGWDVGVAMISDCFAERCQRDGDSHDRVSLWLGPLNEAINNGHFSTATLLWESLDHHLESDWHREVVSEVVKLIGPCRHHEVLVARIIGVIRHDLENDYELENVDLWEGEGWVESYMQHIFCNDDGWIVDKLLEGMSEGCRDSVLHFLGCLAATTGLEQVAKAVVIGLKKVCYREKRSHSCILIARD